MCFSVLYDYDGNDSDGNSNNSIRVAERTVTSIGDNQTPCACQSSLLNRTSYTQVNVHQHRQTLLVWHRCPAVLLTGFRQELSLHPHSKLLLLLLLPALPLFSLSDPSLMGSWAIRCPSFVTLMAGRCLAAARVIICK